MSGNWLDGAMRAAGDGRSEPDLYAQVAVLEAALALLDVAAGACPDLPVVVATLDLGLAASELELASAPRLGFVALVDLEACPGGPEAARDGIVEALSALLARTEGLVGAQDVAVSHVAAQARALVHLRHAARVLASRA